MNRKQIVINDEISEACRREDVTILHFDHPEYPERLRGISDPPAVLYRKGKVLDLSSRPVVSVVGSRECSQAGFAAAHEIGATLAKAGVVLASGMAYGVDCAAMRGALAAGGRVIAVLAGGPEHIYPRENAPIYHACLKWGMVLAEHPPYTDIARYHFTQRNRIVTGLSHLVVVVEAQKQSGSMVSARLALKQGRTLCAVPALGSGNDELLASGRAIPVQDGIRVLGTLCSALLRREDDHPQKEVDNPMRQEYIDLTRQETVQTEETDEAEMGGDARRLLSILNSGPYRTEEISQRSGISAPRLLSLLTQMELEGMAERTPDGAWRRPPRIGY